MQWCPNCVAWRPSALLSNRIVTGSELVSQPGSPRCSFRQQVHTCTTCNDEFTTVNLADCHCASPWDGSAELARARKALGAASAAPRDDAAIDYRASHPGLAEFSPVLLVE